MESNGGTVPTTMLHPLCVLTSALATPQEAARQASELFEAGVLWVQYRSKIGSDADRFKELRELSSRLPAGAILTINDRADLAALLRIGSVHLGDRDLPAIPARQILGETVQIGVSTHSPQEASAASEGPVDYVALGPIYSSSSKATSRIPLGLGALGSARKGVIGKHLVAIGGIREDHLEGVFRTRADAVAVISAVWDSPRPIEAAKRMFDAAFRCRNESVET